MSISIFVCDLAPQVSIEVCGDCGGTGIGSDGFECLYCEEGKVVNHIYPEGMEPINMSNVNAATVLKAIDKQFSASDPCGYWDRDRMSVVLIVVEAMLATDAYEFLVRKAKSRGNVTEFGIDRYYLEARLRHIKTMLLAARAAGKTVGYA